MQQSEPEHFAQQLGAVIDGHFASRPGILENVAAGAAFEEWFALECRLAIEASRTQLGLTEKSSCDGHDVWRYWTANEYKKVDLFIGDYAGDGDESDACYAAIEFKLIHNNKNWHDKCEQVHHDLTPTREKKTDIVPILGRFAIPVLIGKSYWASDTYQQSKHDSVEDWLGDVDKMLSPAARELWRSPVRTVVGEYIEPPSHLEFRILTNPS